MIVSMFLNKIKHFLLFFVNIFKRALCCFHRRRRNSFDAVPLTHVGVVANKSDAEENWMWEEQSEFSEPKTVQDHIELYRKRKLEAQMKANEPSQEDQLNFFEDMTPRITRQTKVVVGSGDENSNANSVNRLNLNETVPLETDGELREWSESSGWEGETLDWDAQEALREKRRQDRERKLWEQQQKRQEKVGRSLGARVSS